MSPKSTAKITTEIVIDPRCKYVAASGRRCRTFASRDTSRTSGYSAFCLTHAQMEQQFLDAKSVAEDLIGPIDDFRTNTAINEVLGHLLKLVAQNRIPLRNANALSYICQLLLNSNEGVRHETNLVGGEEYEMKIINESMDTMWPDEDGDAEDKEDADKESDEDEEQGAKEENDPQNKEQIFAQPGALDKALKLLSGS
jgi:hypothetical protein